MSRQVMSRLDRVAQMSKQEEIIAKRREALKEKQKTAELAKQVVAAQAQAQTANSTTEINSERVEEMREEKLTIASKIPSEFLVAHKNNFSNDGSFLENFKKILEAANKNGVESAPTADSGEGSSIEKDVEKADPTNVNTSELTDNSQDNSNKSLQQSPGSIENLPLINEAVIQIAARNAPPPPPPLPNFKLLIPNQSHDVVQSNVQLNNPAFIPPLMATPIPIPDFTTSVNMPMQRPMNDGHPYQPQMNPMTSNQNCFNMSTHDGHAFQSQMGTIPPIQNLPLYNPSIQRPFNMSTMDGRPFQTQNGPMAPNQNLPFVNIQRPLNIPADNNQQFQSQNEQSINLSIQRPVNDGFQPRIGLMAPNQTFSPLNSSIEPTLNTPVNDGLKFQPQIGPSAPNQNLNSSIQRPAIDSLNGGHSFQSQMSPMVVNPNDPIDDGHQQSQIGPIAPNQIITSSNSSIQRPLNTSLYSMAPIQNVPPIQLPSNLLMNDGGPFQSQIGPVASNQSIQRPMSAPINDGQPFQSQIIPVAPNLNVSSSNSPIQRSLSTSIDDRNKFQSPIGPLMPNSNITSLNSTQMNMSFNDAQPFHQKIGPMAPNQNVPLSNSPIQRPLDRLINDGNKQIGPMMPNSTNQRPFNDGQPFYSQIGSMAPNRNVPTSNPTVPCPLDAPMVPNPNTIQRPLNTPFNDGQPFQPPNQNLSSSNLSIQRNAPINDRVNPFKSKMVTNQSFTSANSTIQRPLNAPIIGPIPPIPNVMPAVPPGYKSTNETFRQIFPTIPPLLSNPSPNFIGSLSPLNAIPPKALMLQQIPSPKGLDLDAIPEPKMNLDLIHVPDNKDYVDPTSNRKITKDHDPTTVESLIEMVAEYGDDYEDILRSRKIDMHSPLWFLAEKGSFAYRSYRKKLMESRGGEVCDSTSQHVHGDMSTMNRGEIRNDSYDQNEKYSKVNEHQINIMNRGQLKMDNFDRNEKYNQMNSMNRGQIRNDNYDQMNSMNRGQMRNDNYDQKYNKVNDQMNTMNRGQIRNDNYDHKERYGKINEHMNSMNRGQIRNDNYDRKGRFNVNEIQNKDYHLQGIQDNAIRSDKFTPKYSSTNIAGRGPNDRKREFSNFSAELTDSDEDEHMEMYEMIQRMENSPKYDEHKRDMNQPPNRPGNLNKNQPFLSGNSRTNLNAPQDNRDTFRFRPALSPELLSTNQNNFRNQQQSFGNIDNRVANSNENTKTSQSQQYRKKRSRWGEKIEDQPVKDIISPILGMSGQQKSVPNLSSITRSDPALLAYARQSFGTINLSEEDWRKCEEHYKINLLYQDMQRKRNEIDRLAKSGRFKYEYDSDEECEGGTWEHKLRTSEMHATAVWADALTKQSEGKHHIGDFLPPEELKKFMEQYNSKQQNREPDLSDYKEYKLKEDNIGFKMLQKLGWKDGEGLGSDGAGIVDPINKATVRDNNQGLGSTSSVTPVADDNEYDAYRKRMMLAYRFRPNPLNNPRRAYY